MKEVNCGRTTPYWLRAAQLKVGGDCLWNAKIPSTDEYDPWCPSFAK